MGSAQRDAAACEMRTRNHTYQEISDALGYGDRSHAYRAIQRALAAIPTEAAEELRRLHSARLDYLATQALQILEREHVTITQAGRIVVDDEGRQIVDDGPTLAAIDRLLRIQERQAKLMGLDAPSRHEVMTLDSLDARIAELTAQLGGGTPTAEADADPGARD
jgi:hypothetical protein